MRKSKSWCSSSIRSGSWLLLGVIYRAIPAHDVRIVGAAGVTRHSTIATRHRWRLRRRSSLLRRLQSVSFHRKALPPRPSPRHYKVQRGWAHHHHHHHHRCCKGNEEDDHLQQFWARSHWYICTENKSCQEKQLARERERERRVFAHVGQSAKAAEVAL